MASNDKVIATAPQDCCLRGTIHEGEAKGKTVSIHGVDTYVAEPPAEKANGNVVIVRELSTKSNRTFSNLKKSLVLSGRLRYETESTQWLA